MLSLTPRGGQDLEHRDHRALADARHIGLDVELFQRHLEDVAGAFGSLVDLPEVAFLVSGQNPFHGNMPVLELGPLGPVPGRTGRFGPVEACGFDGALDVVLCRFGLGQKPRLGRRPGRFRKHMDGLDRKVSPFEGTNQGRRLGQDLDGLFDRGLVGQLELFVEIVVLFFLFHGMKDFGFMNRRSHRQLIPVHHGDLVGVFIDLGVGGIDLGLGSGLGLGLENSGQTLGFVRGVIEPLVGKRFVQRVEGRRLVGGFDRLHKVRIVTEGPGGVPSFDVGNSQDVVLGRCRFRGLKGAVGRLPFGGFGFADRLGGGRNLGLGPRARPNRGDRRGVENGVGVDLGRLLIRGQRL